MILLLRSCIFSQRKLLIQEVASFRRTFMYSTNNNIKKFAPFLQARHLSMKNNETVGGELIYTGSLTSRVRNLKLVSIITSILTSFGQPIIFSKIIIDDNLIGIAALFAVINLVSIGTPIFVHLLTRRYVITMYKSQNEKYIAKVYSFLGRQKQIIFTPNDVSEPQLGAFTTCITKGRPLLFDKKDFIDPKHYFIIMRYNKPIDLEILKDSNETSITEPSIIKKINEEK
ncbi:PREDICTED: transmembrane protein 70 homolog, mitochondrial [Eufriesea mexicana]|uniref:transmembrane protein 70 homolog, mitochondrial n=1 Tax=Eufriesea mexicana TaxID=516756 RepID=UPI00083C3EC2|nr:PREDICTED: transmembrane protein 70 homolog, mitochondrial [Eufriesea mexicana]